jgi:hypothetical protein
MIDSVESIAKHAPHGAKAVDFQSTLITFTFLAFDFILLFVDLSPNKHLVKFNVVMGYERSKC